MSKFLRWAVSHSLKVNALAWLKLARQEMQSAEALPIRKAHRPMVIKNTMITTNNSNSLRVNADGLH